MIAAKFTELAARALFPPGLYCACCGKFIDDKRAYSLCDHCVERMKFDVAAPVVEGFDFALTAMGYGAYERRLIFALKYDGRLYMARTIAEILRDCLIFVLEREGGCPALLADCITEVPLSPARYRRRGFNQAEKIASHLGRLCGIRHEAGLLLRSRETEAQRSLSAEERRRNVEGAFAVAGGKGGLVSGKSILLIDDIYTTGATAAACGRALREAGARRLYFLALLNAANRHHEPPQDYQRG